MLRNIGGVLLGLIAGIVAYVIVASISSALIPVSARMNPHDPVQVKAAFESLPIALKLVMMSDWLAAGLVGGLAAKWIGNAAWPIWTVAILFALLVAMTVAVLPMPGWMQAGSLVAPLLGAALTQHFGPVRAVQVEEEEEEAEPDQTYV